MIRAIGMRDDGREYYLLGITAENVTLLKDGRPLLLEASSVEKGPSYPDVLIVYGETYDEVMANLRLLGEITSDTVEHIDYSANSFHPTSDHVILVPPPPGSKEGRVVAVSTDRRVMAPAAATWASGVLKEMVDERRARKSTGDPNG